LTQKGLITKILQATGLENCNPNQVPVTTQLAKDPDGEAMTDDWSYPLVIGMLLYLTTNKRPDIMFAVNQVARFTHELKQSHASAVKMIVKGMIVKCPTLELKLDCYVDADFPGLYKAEKDECWTVPSLAQDTSSSLVDVPLCQNPTLSQQFAYQQQRANTTVSPSPRKHCYPFRA
jgi:hypothetical protein